MTISQDMQAALAHHRAGRLTEAERFCRQALKLQPNNPETLHFAGVIELQLGRNRSAAELFEKALRIEPSNPDLLVNVGVAYRRLGRAEDAERSYRAALALNLDAVSDSLASPLYCPLRRRFTWAM